MTFESLPDFTVTYHKGKALIWALSDRAKTWALEHIPQAPGERVHASTAVCLKSLDDLAQRIRRSGFTI